MNKMMHTRPSYPGMMPGMQGNMPGMIGLEKQYPMGFKPQPTMPQGQMLRQQLQARLVSSSCRLRNEHCVSRVQTCKATLIFFLFY